MIRLFACVLLSWVPLFALVGALGARHAAVVIGAALIAGLALVVIFDSLRSNRAKISAALRGEVQR